MKLAFTFRVISEPTTFAGIIFHFLKILGSLKLVNYTKLDVKPAHSLNLRMEDRFSVFVNGFGSPGKGVALDIETFVCDGSDNGVACN